MLLSCGHTGENKPVIQGHTNDPDCQSAAKKASQSDVRNSNPEDNKLVNRNVIQQIMFERGDVCLVFQFSRQLPDLRCQNVPECNKKGKTYHSDT